MSNKFLIKSVKARWILDSRGFPTIEADVLTENGILGRAAVPSGASTGEHEVVKIIDGGKRFLGRGVNKAINNVNNEISKIIIGKDVRKQKEIDDAMINLDGTKNKSKLGGNAILSVSLAVADAASKALGLNLFEYLYKLYRENSNEIKYIFPVPMSNVLNGGKHAGNNLSVQEFMIVPIGAKDYRESIVMISEIYQYLKNEIKSKFGKSAINLGDEGGFAPNLSYTKDALDLLMSAIEDSGYKAKKEIFIAMDAASSEFYKDGKYFIDEKFLSADELMDYYIELINSYPIISIEDPFEENDFQAFAKLLSKIGNKIQIVGDDLFVTQIERIKIGIQNKSANALLLKVDQVGSLTESLEAAKLCDENNMNVIVSHRSGETESTFIADLAVGLSLRRIMIKTGAPARGERTAKYNRLLRIYDLIGENAEFSGNNFNI